MKSYGLVIDQSLQPSIPYNNLTNLQQSSNYPRKAVQSNNTESYSTVVEQSILTQDRPLLKEIIAQCSSKLITNTIASLSAARVSSLLNLLEEFIYQDSKNTEAYCAWLKELVCRHMGIILSNGQNKNVVSRLRKFIQKKQDERSNLMILKKHSQTIGSQVEQTQYTPRFVYVESQGNEQPVEIQEDADELIDEEDLMLDEYND